MARFPALQRLLSVSVIILTTMFVSFFILHMETKAPEFTGSQEVIKRETPSNVSFWKTYTDIPQNPTPAGNLSCAHNALLQEIPKGIPEAHQIFLRYKHCRFFPRLQTPTPCEDDLFLLLAIKSIAVQVDRRAALRGTWGKAGLIQGKKVKLVFLVGQAGDMVQNYSLQALLDWENEEYGDILQWDFLDTFFNLTLKEVHFLRWFSSECRAAQFVFKGDDDVFVHTHNMLEYLKQYNSNQHLFAGEIIDNAFPIRKTTVKYFIPLAMYPDRLYPPYAGGGGYLMSRKTVVSINEVASDIDLFPIDDVFVGMCLQKLPVKPMHHHGFRTFGLYDVMDHFNPCIYRQVMLVHKLNTTEMWFMWSLLLHNGLVCDQEED